LPDEKIHTNAWCPHRIHQLSPQPQGSPSNHASIPVTAHLSSSSSKEWSHQHSIMSMPSELSNLSSLSPSSYAMASSASASTLLAWKEVPSRHPPQTPHAVTRARQSQRPALKDNSQSCKQQSKPNLHVNLFVNSAPMNVSADNPPNHRQVNGPVSQILHAKQRARPISPSILPMTRCLSMDTLEGVHLREEKEREQRRLLSMKMEIGGKSCGTPCVVNFHSSNPTKISLEVGRQSPPSYGTSDAITAEYRKQFNGPQYTSAVLHTDEKRAYKNQQGVVLFHPGQNPLRSSSATKPITPQSLARRYPAEAIANRDLTSMTPTTSSGQQHLAYLQIDTLSSPLSGEKKKYQRGGISKKGSSRQRKQYGSTSDSRRLPLTAPLFTRNAHVAKPILDCNIKRKRAGQTTFGTFVRA